MTFVSFAYALLLPVVFLLCRLAAPRSARGQNIVLLAASYIFYGWWDWRFLGLLALVTFVTYGCALPATHRRRWTALAVTVDLGVLFVFKYLGFFAENLGWLFANFGWELDWFTVEILLPVGISFYVFQAVGYSVDVCRGEIPPERDPLTFALFVSFFPQLVAGPIERAGALLPQFHKPRGFDYAGAVEGSRRILWGLFKKVVVADGVARWVQHAFIGTAPSGMELAVGACLFSVQIYADFSGYSDIAVGSARLLGVRLTDNFLFPFFSRNGAELWRRWHVSLMEWFRQYVYIPMGGSRRGNVYVYLLVVFLLSGLWHGAAWTFVAWGLLNGLWVAFDRAVKVPVYRPAAGPAVTRADIPDCIFTFWLFTWTFIFFRADSLPQALAFVRDCASGMLQLLGGALVLGWTVRRWRRAPLWLAVAAVGVVVAAFAYRPADTFDSVLFHLPWIAAAAMFVAEWYVRGRGTFGLACVPRRGWLRATLYLALAFLVFTGAIHAGSSFIYFRF